MYQSFVLWKGVKYSSLCSIGSAFQASLCYPWFELVYGACKIHPTKGVCPLDARSLKASLTRSSSFLSLIIVFGIRMWLVLWLFQ